MNVRTHVSGCAIAIIFAAAASAQALAQAAPLPPALPPALRAAVAAIADSARREGLPADLLEAKAAEGVAKGAGAEAIVTVVAEYRRLLKRSKEILGGSPQSGELAAAASALKSGIPDKSVAEVKRAAGSRPATVPLVVLTDLVTRGIRAADATSAVRSLTAGGASDAELTDLRMAIAQDIAGGRDPMRTLHARSVRTPPPTHDLAAPPLEFSAGTAIDGRIDGSTGFGVSGSVPLIASMRLGGAFGLGQGIGTPLRGADAWRVTLSGGSRAMGARAGVSRWTPSGAGLPTQPVFGMDAEGWMSLRPDLALRGSVSQYSAGFTQNSSSGGQQPIRPDTGGCVAPVSNPQACSQSSGRVRVASSIAGSVLWGRGHWMMEAGGGTSVMGASATWLTLGATRWIIPGLGATFSTGGDPRIVGRNTPARAGFVFRPFSREARRDVGAAVARESPSAARVEEYSGKSVLVVPSVSAKLVEVRGDVTGWQPVAMTEERTGEWRAALALSAGLHHIQVRIDGNVWVAPAGLPIVADDFWGMVGVIVR